MQSTTCPSCSSLARKSLTYTDEDDLVEKIGNYLADEDERRRIARAGQQRTLREHTYAHRMQELVDVLERYLP